MRSNRRACVRRAGGGQRTLVCCRRRYRLTRSPKQAAAFPHTQIRDRPDPLQHPSIVLMPCEGTARGTRVLEEGGYCAQLPDLGCLGCRESHAGSMSTSLAHHSSTVCLHPFFWSRTPTASAKIRGRSKQEPNFGFRPSPDTVFDGDPRRTQWDRDGLCQPLPPC